MSVSRSSRSFTVRWVLAAITAAAAAISAGCVSLPPNPPPMRRHWTVTSCERHDLLHLRGVLSRAHDEHRAVFLWRGNRDLPFEVKMILTADTNRSGQT